MKKHFLIFTISLLFFSLAQGKVKLPAMMGDHMVLQQNSSVKLWGLNFREIRSDRFMRESDI